MSAYWVEKFLLLVLLVEEEGVLNSEGEVSSEGVAKVDEAYMGLRLT